MYFAGCLCVVLTIYNLISFLISTTKKYINNRKPYQKYRIIKETYGDGLIGYNVWENLEGFNHEVDAKWKKHFWSSPYVENPRNSACLKTYDEAVGYIESLQKRDIEVARSRVVKSEVVN